MALHNNSNAADGQKLLVLSSSSIAAADLRRSTASVTGCDSTLKSLSGCSRLRYLDWKYL